jgi:formamidopyrimidine-DNA glycosylase
LITAGKNPLIEDPINKLGFDPVLNLPTLDIFSQMVLKRSVPVKALLLDQSFSAGVGNWVADEILYQAKIHPAQYTNTLTQDELVELYNKLKFVCETAVNAEADESKFPQDWLMKYRWNKGKKTDQILPNGLSIHFETVGGRTSAFAPSRQKLRKSKVVVSKKTLTKKSVAVVNKKIVKKKTYIKEEDKDLLMREETEPKTRTASSRYNFRSS